VASVVGLSHLFRTVADSNGAGLKSLAAILGKSCNNAYGRFKIVLRRNHNVPADENAVSVLVPKSDQTSEGGKSYIASDFCCALYIDPSFSHLSYDFEI
jgi:hypothetical protein